MRRLLVFLVIYTVFIIFPACASISYFPANNTIVVVGYTDSVPCTFSDVYAADQAGAWGVVTHTSGSTGMTDYYSLNAAIVIGNGVNETYFKDSNIMLHILHLDANFMNYHIDVKNLSLFQLGVLIDKDTKTTGSGCSVFLDLSYNSLLIHGEDNSTINLYGGFYSNGYTIGLNGIWIPMGDIYNANFNTIDFFQGGGNLSVHRVNLQNPLYGFYSVDGSFNEVNIQSVGYCIRFYSPHDIVITNSSFNRVTNGSVFYMLGLNSGDLVLIDCVSNYWNFEWGICDSNLTRRYSFDVQVINESGFGIANASFIIQNSQDEIVFSGETDSNGSIPTQILNFGFYNSTGGDIPYLEGPYLITINKDKYREIEFLLSIDKEHDLVLSLEQEYDLMELGMWAMLIAFIYFSRTKYSSILLSSAAVVYILYITVYVNDYTNMVLNGFYILLMTYFITEILRGAKKK